MKFSSLTQYIPKYAIHRERYCTSENELPSYERVVVIRSWYYGSTCLLGVNPLWIVRTWRYWWSRENYISDYHYYFHCMLFFPWSLMVKYIVKIRGVTYPHEIAFVMWELWTPIWGVTIKLEFIWPHNCRATSDLLMHRYIVLIHKSRGLSGTTHK